MITRPQDGDYDGIAFSDMGAYETFALTSFFIAFWEFSSSDYIPDDAFRNQKNRIAVKNKIEMVIGMIKKGQYRQALNKLETDIHTKTEGCALSGTQAKNDWTVDSQSQIAFYNFASQGILNLRNIIAR